MTNSIKHIQNYTAMHGKTVSLNEASAALDALQADMRDGSIKKTDPLAKQILTIQQSLIKLLRVLQNQAIANPAETPHVTVTIDKDSLKNYNQALEGKGLGFLPVVIAAAAGKALEYTVGKFLKKKDVPLEGLDCACTKQEALKLGIVGYSGLGFVNPTQAFKKVNREILEHINSGDLIWRKPWRDGYRVKGTTYGPQNYETQLPYRGYNAWLINFINFQRKEQNEYFLTAKQIRERGGKLKKDAVPYPVSAFIKGEKAKTVKVKGKEKEVIEEYAGWVHYIVYPINHVEDLKLIVRRETKEVSEKPDEIIVEAEDLIKFMPKAPPIKHGGDRAYYATVSDYVQMPVKKAFPDKKKYYSVLFHELIHSTGHKKRVGRTFGGAFGNKAYAFEELIAELGAAYLCAVVNIDYHTLKSSAAYLKSWGKKLTNEIKADPQFLFRAVYASTKAAKYIIGTTLEKSGFKKPQEVSKTKTSIRSRIEKTAKPAKVKAVAPKQKKQSSQLKLELNGLNGIMSIAQMKQAKFDEIGLDGDWLKLIGKACKPTSFFIYGPGGSGKSTLCLKFAYYMANRKNKIAYVAGEQYNTPVFRDMLIRLKIEDSPFFTIVRSLDLIDIKNYDIIVIDSKDSLGYTLDQFTADKKKYPKQSFLILSQGTKAGDFTGSEKWRNEVDTMIYCENLIAYTNKDKNRWGGSHEVDILSITTNEVKNQKP